MVPDGARQLQGRRRPLAGSGAQIFEKIRYRRCAVKGRETRASQFWLGLPYCLWIYQNPDFALNEVGAKGDD